MRSEINEKAAARRNFPPPTPHSRKGMNGLAALVQEQLRADPFSGTIYSFLSKRVDRGKARLLGWHWPFPAVQASGGRQVPLAAVQDGVRLSAAQLSALLDGLDWSRMHTPR
jgi:transposase